MARLQEILNEVYQEIKPDPIPMSERVPIIINSNLIVFAKKGKDIEAVRKKYEHYLSTKPVIY